MGTNPIGSVFDPSDLQLVRDYLRNKVEKGQNSSITEMDVYQVEPWHLQPVTPHPFFKVREWFYFVPSRQGGGKRPQERTVPGRNGESKSGTWRAIDGKSPIIDGDDVLIGYRASFVYRKKEEGGSFGRMTSWFLTEYSLCDGNWVLCRIRYRPPPEKIDGRWCFLKV